MLPLAIAFIAGVLCAVSLMFIRYKPFKFVPPVKVDEKHATLTAVMPFTYRHLAEIVNLIDYANTSRHTRTVWQSPDTAVHSDLITRCLDRINLLELAGREGCL